jgi:hypothetical protein
VTGITGVKSQSFGARSRIAEGTRLFKKRIRADEHRSIGSMFNYLNELEARWAEFRAAAVHAVTSFDGPPRLLSLRGRPRNCRLGRISIIISKRRFRLRDRSPVIRARGGRDRRSKFELGQFIDMKKLTRPAAFDDSTITISPSPTERPDDSGPLASEALFFAVFASLNT